MPGDHVLSLSPTHEIPAAIAAIGAVYHYCHRLPCYIDRTGDGAVGVGGRSNGGQQE